MKHNLALPMPGTAEPQGKPSKTVKLGETPVLPPPPKALDEAAVAKVVKAKADAPPAVGIRPVVAEAPPPNMRVEREALQPAPQPMKRERSKSGVHKIKKTQKAKPREVMSMDDECAVVAIDPRRPRNE